MTAALALRDDEYELIAELEDRERLRALLIDDNFPEQAAFIRDTSPRVAALCTRRAGKSYGIGAKFFADSLDYPGANYLYLALTRLSAKNIMWRDVVKHINTKLGIGAVPNESELNLTLPKGGIIQLAGADASRDEMEKYLGGKYRGIVIDETGSFKQDTEKLIIENLEPATADWEGWVNMIGTPTMLTESYFHKVTSGRVAGWINHAWNTFDNPHMATKWEKMILRLRETYGDILEQLPWFQRMYRGKWVTDDSALVYKFNPDRNLAAALPDSAFVYVLGIDLGFEDPTAFVLLAYSKHLRTTYVVETYKKSGLGVAEIAERIRHYQARYQIYDMVIDNANKQFVEEIKSRHHFPLEAADKAGKAEVIEILNADMLAGHIKLLPAAETLSKEMASLIWDETKKPRREEHPRCENHACDAFLYAWRKSMSYASRPEQKPPETETERLDLWELEECMKLEQAQAEHWEY